MNPLVIDGFTEHTGDWLFAARLRANGYGGTVERECEQNDDTNSAKLADIQAADSFGVYSFGGSTFWDETNCFSKIGGGSIVRLMVMVAPVLDWAKGQFKGWNVPAGVQRAYCFQPTKAVPVSQPIEGAPWFDITDPNLKVELIAAPHANINCDALFSDPGLNIFAAVDIHTTVMNHPSVLDLATWMFQTFAPAQGAVAVPTNAVSVPLAATASTDAPATAPKGAP